MLASYSDITIVVDTGKVKETQYEAEKSMQMLVEVLTRFVKPLDPFLNGRYSSSDEMTMIALHSV